MSLFKKYLPDTIILVLVLLTGLKIAYLSENITDLNNFDESAYLFRGASLNPFTGAFTDGFLYYVWYKLISFFANNNIDLFFLNNSILLVLPGLMLYVFLRAIKVNMFISFISSVTIIISSANVLVFPLITKFALCVMLAGFIIIYKISDQRNKLLGSVCLSAVLTYIRPEFFLTLVLTTVVYLIFVFKNRTAPGKKFQVSDFIPLVPVFLLILFFNPVSRHRANVAFSQQVAIELSERKINAGHTTGNREIWENYFSDGSPMSEIVIKNPGLFFEHTCFNLQRMYESSVDILPYFLLQDRLQYLNVSFYVVIIVLLISFLYFLFKRIRNKSSGSFSLIYFLFFIPPFISVLVFYPRLHYMIFLFALVLIYLSFEFSNRISRHRNAIKFAFPSAIISGILILIFLPFRGDAKSIHEKDCTMLHSVRLLNEFEFNDTVNFFAAHPGFLTYMNRNWNYFTGNIIEKDTYEFFYRNNINVVLVDDYFFMQPLINNDKNLLNMLNDQGFVKMNLPGCNSYLLVRKEIVK